MNLKSKTAIITGASSGVGFAFTSALVNKGVTVYGLARNFDAHKKMQGRLWDSFIPIALDITDRSAVETWVKQTFSVDHLPNILINNAGSGRFGKVDEISREQWHQMIDTNINGIFDLTSLIIPLMKQADESAHVVNMGSILGMVGNPEMSGYCASKFAVRGFSEALFKELRYDNIKVTCLNPGSIETDFFVDSGVTPHNNMLQPSDLANTLVHILETPDNMLINEITLRPLNPKSPE
jgi:NADP-dependent 3-hydroxy acid dehydrogenase YdfG